MNMHCRLYIRNTPGYNPELSAKLRLNRFASNEETQNFNKLETETVNLNLIRKLLLY